MKDRSIPSYPANNFFLICFVAVLAVALAWPALGHAATGRTLVNSTPAYVPTSKNLGREDASKVIEVSLWLHVRNRDQFDVLTQSLYDRTSPNYRHWLKSQDIVVRFAPTTQQVNSVRDFLTAHNLKVVKIGANNFYVRAQGTVADVEKAFHVELNNYLVGNKTVRANNTDPYIEGAAADLVRAISGLDNAEFKHPAMARPTLNSKNSGVAAAKANTTPSTLDLFSSQCFTGTEKETFSTNADGELPMATYKGNKLNAQSVTSNGCAYTPPAIQTAYNLTGLYQEGFDGTGQTIAIVDWCGSSTIQSDANAFSATFGLPALTSSNFAITYTTPSLCVATDQTEINLDVE